MNSGASTKLNSSLQQNSLINLKLGLYNLENLFLIFDQPLPPHYLKLTEAQWQKLSSSVYENKPLSKCIQIAEIIKQQRPDILMLCEVGGPESLKNFNEHFLDSEFHIALIEGNSDRNIDVGYLIRKNMPFQHDLISHKQRPLNFLYPHENTSVKTGYPVRGSTHFFSRDCAELRLFTDSSQNPFMILLLTHLKSRLDPERIDPGGTERRSAELRTAVDIYKELRQRFPQTPMALCGDMNGYAGQPDTDPEFLPLYSETDLEDVLHSSQVSIEKRSTFFQIKSSGRSEGKQIDYCFLSPELWPRTKPSESYVYRYQDEFGFDMDMPKTIDDKLRLPSDHYPLFFTLENLKI